MKTYSIKKGHHYSRPLSLGLFFNKTHFRWSAIFDTSAKYTLPGNHQLDINKLCGIKYLFGGDNSARFGWRYNPIKEDSIEILAYVHDNGVITRAANEISLGFIKFHQFFVIELEVTNDSYLFYFKGNLNATVKKNHNNTISIKQNLYFGGEETAPQKIEVLLDKLI